VSAGFRKREWRTARAPCVDQSSSATFFRRFAIGCCRILPEDLRGLCAKVKERGAPATAVHVRDIVKLVFAFAILHGEKVANPADEVGPASIATFVPKDRSLSPAEIRIMLGQIEHVATLPTIRLGIKLILLSMVRKRIAGRGLG
jgi:hypothetical protein